MLELKNLIIDELIRLDQFSSHNVNDYLQELKQKKNSRDIIEDGSLVLLDCNGKQAMYFMTASHSAHMLSIHEKVVMLVTPFSALGMQLIGKTVKDHFKIQHREYQIIDIF
jgi:hypothetical protein